METQWLKGLMRAPDLQMFLQKTAAVTDSKYVDYSLCNIIKRIFTNI